MRVDDTDGTRIVMFDEPEAKNASTTNVARKLSAALEELTPKAFDAAVITGDGDALSTGGDIQAMTERDGTAREAYECVHGVLGRAAKTTLTVPVLVVVRVNGDAVGTGIPVVAACDLAYVTRDTHSGALFINTGLVPDIGTTVTLSQLVGLRAVKELAPTGRLVSAERATELDLVNEAIAVAELDATIDETVEVLAAQPTEMPALAKEAIRANLGRSWTGDPRREVHAQTLAYGTDVHEERVAAFLEKRRPEFE